MIIERIREQAISEYHELLAGDESLTPALFARLKSGMSCLPLLYGERPLGVALRPHLLTREQYDTLTSASEALASALDKISAAVIAQPALMERLGMDEAARRLALVEPGYAYP